MVSLLDTRRHGTQSIENRGFCNSTMSVNLKWSDSILQRTLVTSIIPAHAINAPRRSAPGVIPSASTRSLYKSFLLNVKLKETPTNPTGSCFGAL